MPDMCRITVPPTKPRIWPSGAAAGPSVPWAKPWKKPKVAAPVTASATGMFAFAINAAPKRTTEVMITVSTRGTVTPVKAYAAPETMAETKASGSRQSAEPPSRAAISPTATKASRWSRPEKGWRKPLSTPWKWSPE